MSERFDTHRLVADLPDAGVKAVLEMSVVKGVVQGVTLNVPSTASLSANDFGVLADTYQEMRQIAGADNAADVADHRNHPRLADAGGSVCFSSVRGEWLAGAGSAGAGVGHGRPTTPTHCSGSLARA